MATRAATLEGRPARSLPRARGTGGVARAAALVALAFAASLADATSVRGANSWYSYFGAANETQVLAAGRYMADRLLSHGYDTYTIDEGWQEDNGAVLIDAFGRPRWNAALYPSGIDGLAAQLGAMGIKLGLWLIRGVPIAAAQQRLPIYGGGGATADAAARPDRNCSWSSTHLGSTAPSAPAAAYYASVARLIASWGVALVKIDCLWPNRYEGTPQQYFNEDVEAMTAAFSAAGLQLSLSPGISVSPLNGSWVAANRRAAFYRIAEDVLDVYDGPPDGTFPQGVHQKLAKALEYEALLDTAPASNGTSPDFDMLQVGRVIHSYGSGALPATETRLSRDEQAQAVTLFCFTGVPLVIGGVLPLDEGANGTATLALLTNDEVLLVHNESLARASFTPVEAGAGGGGAPELHGWRATPARARARAATRHVALLSASTAPQAASARFVEDLGLPAGTTAACVRDLWAHTFEQPVGGPLPGAGGGAAGFTVGVPPHGARAFLVAPLGSADCANGLAA